MSEHLSYSDIPSDEYGFSDIYSDEHDEPNNVDEEGRHKHKWEIYKYLSSIDDSDDSIDRRCKAKRKIFKNNNTSSDDEIIVPIEEKEDVSKESEAIDTKDYIYKDDNINKINRMINKSNEWKKLSYHVQTELYNAMLEYMYKVSPKVIRVIDKQNAISYYIKETPCVAVSFEEYILNWLLITWDESQLMNVKDNRDDDFIYTAKQTYEEKYLNHCYVGKRRFDLNPNKDGTVDDTIYYE